MRWKHTNNRMQKKLNDFGLKYGNQKYKEKAEKINYTTKELEGAKGSLNANRHINVLKTILKKSNWNTTNPDGIRGF